MGYNEILEGSPEDKFFEILKIASSSAIKDVLIDLFKELLILEAYKNGEELDEYSQEMQNRLNGLYIELTLKIVKKSV